MTGSVFIFDAETFPGVAKVGNGKQVYAVFIEENFFHLPIILTPSAVAKR